MTELLGQCGRRVKFYLNDPGVKTDRKVEAHLKTLRTKFSNSKTNCSCLMEEFPDRKYSP